MEENSTPTVDAPIGPLTPGTAIGRTAHTFYLHPVDWHAAPELLLRLADRVEVADAETQVLILVPDADAAVAIAQAWNAARGNTYPRAMAATGASRTERVLRAGAAPVVLGTPREILALVRSAALKLGGLRALALAWVDEILTTGAMTDLEAVMADVPHDIVRTVIASAATPEVDAVLERYARRPVRVTTDVGGGGAGAGDSVRMDGGASYITVTPATRPDALRRLLDDLDPPSAAIYVRTDPAERAVAECLIALGYHGANAPIHVLRGGGSASSTPGPANHTALLVLYELPHTAQELRAAAVGLPAVTVALAQPRQLPHLRRLIGGAALPMVLSGPVHTARRSEDATRAELRRELTHGTPARELLTLEPLLAEYDGTELAAAALVLLERERRRPAVPPPAPPAASPAPRAPTGGSRPAASIRGPGGPLRSPTPPRDRRPNTRPLPRKP